MRKKFSSTYGYKDPRNAFQKDSIDDELKNRIWNQIRIFFIDSVSLNNRIQKEINSDQGYRFFENIYDGFFKVDSKPKIKIDGLREDIKIKYSHLKWYEIYDFVEFVAKEYYDQKIASYFTTKMNEVLKNEMSGFRIIGNIITPIIDEVEIKEVEEALSCKYTPVKQHLSNALELLSDKEDPDYQNSIKEPITAVESTAKIITGKETDLAKCLKSMDIDLNNQFKTSMINLYGWTCKEDGIRHGHTEEVLKTSFEEAKYMLVSCSAFVNYLIAKSE